MPNGYSPTDDRIATIYKTLEEAREFKGNSPGALKAWQENRNRSGEPGYRPHTIINGEVVPDPPRAGVAVDVGSTAVAGTFHIQSGS